MPHDVLVHLAVMVSGGSYRSRSSGFSKGARAALSGLRIRYGLKIGSGVEAIFLEISDVAELSV